MATSEEKLKKLEEAMEASRADHNHKKFMEFLGSEKGNKS